MSPKMGDMLVSDVVPRLRAAASSVAAIGHEDREELVADMTANAAKMIDSAERAGKKFSGGNIAFYASRAARSGRRSTGSSRSDALSPGAQLDRTVHLDHLDGAPDTGSAGSGGEIADGGCDSGAGLHEIVWPGGATPTDPSEEAARNLDWEAFIATRPRSQRIAILVLAGGGTMREAGRLCGIGDSAACILRKRVAAALVEFFGAETVGRLMAGPKPAWDSDLRAGRERHACGTPASRGRRDHATSTISHQVDE
jgi:hypothetical protein